MADLRLRNLVKRYGNTEVLHGINLDIGQGEFVVLVGPSGCGKSTTLRMIAGLEDISGGQIEIGGHVVNGLEPKDRDVAMVFQNYAIYPHMSVRKNIGFGLRKSKMDKADKSKRIDEVAELLGMSDYLDRKPAALSGGQRQRVAIGRAMVRDPQVFLFDEPLSNLDAQLRTQTRLEIKKLHARVGTTIVFVTHDQIEAMTMADRIVVMDGGDIQQIGTPEEVYHRPANEFVARFIGAPSMNLLPAQVTNAGVKINGGATLSIAHLEPETGVNIGIRPEDIGPEVDGDFVAEGEITVTEPLGPETLLYVRAGDQELIASVDGRAKYKTGDIVKLYAQSENMHFFNAETKERI